MILAKFFSKIYKKSGIVLMDHSGQKFICGNPDLNNPLTLKILKPSSTLKSGQVKNGMILW